jgi:excinuclease ABC subunit C
MTKVKTERIVTLLEKAKSLPKKPGCYLMKSKSDEIIYIGKAKDLKARVSSYFQSGSKGPKTEILVGHIVDFDFQITASDAEAFILENHLIKKHTPKYNIRLRDDKSYPYIVVDYREPFPKLKYIRRVKREANVDVFGPFVHGTSISDVIRTLTKVFGLRDCPLSEFHRRKEPCLLYQMRHCSAPCVGIISKEDYEKELRLATNFFRQKGKESLKILNERMIEFAENEQFERAALVRDSITKLESFLGFRDQKNIEINTKEKNIDIVAFYPGEVELDLAIFMMREGVLLGHKNFHFPIVEFNEAVEEEITTFLFQYYTETYDSLPELIVCDQLGDESISLLDAGLKEKAKIKFTRSGNKFSSLMKLTMDHAFEHQRVRVSGQESVFVALNKLKELLGLKERPITLECFDVAIFQGSSPTASQIVFRDGKPDKTSYRHYHLEERAEGNNDFAMMKEMLRRRIKNGDLPDVLIVDGGKGQVSMFLEVLKELSVSVPVVGIAKSKVAKAEQRFKSSEVERTEERLIIPGRVNPYILEKNKSLFRLITFMRDEAHRFSRRLHHKQEKKKLFKTWVDEIDGVGPKTKDIILKNQRSTVEELSAFTVDQFMNELQVSEVMAKKLRDHFLAKKA